MSKAKLIFKNENVKGYYNRLVVHSDEAGQYWVKKGYEVFKVYENKEGHKEIELTTSEQNYKRIEKIELINKGVEIIKKADRINSKDFESVILELNKYGLNYVDAQNQIIASYENSI